MKRILIFILVLAMTLSLAACAHKPEAQPTQGTNETTTPTLHTHSYTSTVTTDATCSAKGVLTFNCACGDSYTEAIPLAEHTWSNWEMESHAFVGKAGSERRTCSACSLSETRERTANAVANAFYDGGLQYIVSNGITGHGLWQYAAHELHDYIEKESPASAIFAALSQRFNVTDSLKNDMISIGKDMAKYGMYGYNEENDTITLQYSAEQSNFFFLGYIHNGGSNYSIYYSNSDFGIDDTPETFWKFDLEYNMLNGQPNRYLSYQQVAAAPENMIPCPEEERSEFID